MLRRYAIIEVDKPLRSGAASPLGASKSDGAATKIYQAELSERDVLDIKENPAVEDYGLIMPTRLISPVKKQAIDGAASPSWGITAIGADRVNLDCSDITVAVLDTGIDRKHPVFEGINIEEEDFGGSGNGDKDGHGTHCAGTIFGKDYKGTRIGVARNIRKALIAKVFPDGKTGDSLAIFRALEWVANKRANIVSMSLGFDFPGMVRALELDGYPVELATSIGLEHFKDNLRMFDSMMRLIEAGRRFGRGPLVIAASGNESQRERDPRFKISASLPSAAVGVISVASVRKSGATFEVSDFSNARAKILAPGEDIISANKGYGLATMSGTSMACPHVAGLAALWWQHISATAIRPNAEVVAQQMLSSAVTSPINKFDPDDAEVGFAQAPSSMAKQVTPS